MSSTPWNFSGRLSQRLAEDLEGLDADRDLAGPGPLDRAVDADDVPQVELFDEAPRCSRQCPPCSP